MFKRSIMEVAHAQQRSVPFSATGTVRGGRRNSKSTLLDLGPPLRELVNRNQEESEEEEDENPLTNGSVASSSQVGASKREEPPTAALSSANRKSGLGEVARIGQHLFKENKPPLVQRRKLQRLTPKAPFDHSLPSNRGYPLRMGVVKTPNHTPFPTYSNSNCTTDGVGGDNRVLIRGATPASTFPVSHSPAIRDESRTGTRMSHVENGTHPQTQGYPDERTTDKIQKIASFPNLPAAHQPLPSAYRPPIHPSYTPVPSQPPPSPPPSLSAPPPPSFFPPVRDEEIVVMKSPNEERRFKRLELLGRGGSSKVYRVLSEDCKVYALKEVYLKCVDKAVTEAYITEIKFLKRLKDKSEVITLHDFSWDKKESILYLLLEYAETDLASIIKNQEPSIPTALYFWNEMLRIMTVIHNEGIIHNDLKPENFVCIHGRLKLIDFGIANRISDEHTSVERNLRCGTINYMSPETIETHEDNDFFKVGRPSDVWSLGCILYQLLYGKTPFDRYKKLHKLQAIIDSSVTISFPDIGNAAALDIMKKCLNRNPKERPTVQSLLSHPFTLYRTVH